MSASPPRADMLRVGINVCNVPIADIRRCGSNDTPLLINTLNLRRHVRYKTNAIARALPAQQPHLLVGS